MNKIIGKCYWVADDFDYNGFFFPKKDETSHISSRIENVTIDDNMIRFTTSPVEFSGDTFSYEVNLLANDIGLGFTGTFHETEDRETTGPVTCEKFENKKTFFLYGKWTENDINYTWWARINKPG